MKKIENKEQEELVLRDRSLWHWLVDLTFVVGGFALIVVSIVMFKSIPMELFGTMVGVMNLVGGLRMLWKEPLSEVRICRKEGKVRIRRLGLSGLQEVELPLDDFVDADIEVVNHPAGGVFYRPQVLFLKQGAQPLTMLWFDDRERCQATVQKIKDFHCKIT